VSLRKYSCEEIQLLNEFLPCMFHHCEGKLLQVFLGRALFLSQLGWKGGRQVM